MKKIIFSLLIIMFGITLVNAQTNDISGRNVIAKDTAISRYLRLKPQNSLPSNPGKGKIVYYNDTVRIFNGSSWEILGSGSGGNIDTTNLSLRIDSMLKKIDTTTIVKTQQQFNTDTASTSNTGTVTKYMFDRWEAKQNALGFTPVNRADSNLFLPGYYPTMTKVRYMIDTAINAITIDTTQIATLYALNDTAKNLRTTINLKVNFRDSMKLSIGGYSTYKALVDSAGAIRTTLNGKQPLLTNPVTGTMVTGEVAISNGTTTVTSSPTFKYDIVNRILGLNNGNIADVAAPAIQIKNHTPSTTVPAPIHMPATIDFKGTARNSSSGLSENHFWRIQVLPATANPSTSAINYYSSSDSLTWTRRFGVNNSGAADASSFIATGIVGSTGNYLQCLRASNGTTANTGLLMQNATASTGGSPIQKSSYARINGTWYDGTASRTHWGYFYTTGVASTQKQRFIFGQSTDVGAIFNDMFLMEDIRNLTSTDNMLLNRGLFTRRFGFSLIGVNKSMRLQTDTLNSALIYDDAGGFVIAKASKANIDGGYPTISTTDTLLRIDNSGNLKYGSTTSYTKFSSTGRLILPAGGTAAGTAPLKLTTQASGLSTVEQGAFELIGNMLHFTNLAVRRTVVQSVKVLVTDVTVVNTTTETEIWSIPHGDNYLEVGKEEDTKLIGEITSISGVGSNTLTFRIKYAGTTYATFTTTELARNARNFDLHVNTTCRAIGNGTTSIQIHGSIDINQESTDFVINTLATGLNSTIAQATTITAQWSDADAGNTMTISQGKTTCNDNPK